MKNAIILIFLMAIHLVILTRIQFTAWPEMLSYPYLLNNGFKLYQDIALPYQPILIFILAIIYNFLGYSVFNLQIFTWILILISDLFIFLIVRKALNEKLALLSVFVYLAIQPFTDGNMLWFDLAATPFILGGLAAFLYLDKFKKYFFFGLLLSLAALVKQQVALVAVFTLIFIIFSTKDLKSSLYFIGGGLVPILLVLFYVLSNGVLGDYIFWTFQVPLVWYPKSPGYVHLPSTREWFKVLLIFSPLVILLINYLLTNFEKWNKVVLPLFLMFIATFITSFPRFEFFRLQPSIALAIPLTAFSSNLFKKYYILILILPIIFLIKYFPNQINKDGSIRFFSKEDFKIAEVIKSKSGNEEKVYLLDLPSSLYIYTNKLTFKPWVDNYVWYMEIPGIQQKVINGLESEKIKYVFRKLPQGGQWFDLGSYQPKQIVDYIYKNYDLLEVNQDIQIWRRKD